MQLAIPHLLPVVICQTQDPDEAREEREGRESSTQGTLGPHVVRTIGHTHTQRNIHCSVTLFECILTHQRMLKRFPTPATRAASLNRMTGWGPRARIPTKLYDPLLPLHSNHVGLFIFEPLCYVPCTSNQGLFKRGELVECHHKRLPSKGSPGHLEKHLHGSSSSLCKRAFLPSVILLKPEVFEDAISLAAPATLKSSR